MAAITYRFRFRPYLSFESISDDIEEFTGYSRDEFYANPSLALGLVVEGDLNRARRYFAGDAGLSEVEVIRWRHLDGRIITTSHRFTPILEDDVIVGYDVIATILGPNDPGAVGDN